MTRLDRKNVATVLAEFQLRVVQTPEGFELPCGWTLRSGSGIAGRGDVWFLWHTRSTPVRQATGYKSTMVSSRDELRRILREYMADPLEKPPSRPGYTIYAKRHSNRNGDGWIWNYRRNHCSDAS